MGIFYLGLLIAACLLATGLALWLVKEFFDRRWGRVLDSNLVPSDMGTVTSSFGGVFA